VFQKRSYVEFATYRLLHLEGQAWEQAHPWWA